MRKPVNFTLSAVPFVVWKAAQDEATNRQVPTKTIWIEAVCKLLNIEVPNSEEQIDEAFLAAAREVNDVWFSRIAELTSVSQLRSIPTFPGNEEIAAIISKHVGPTASSNSTISITSNRTEG